MPALSNGPWQRRRSFRIQRRRPAWLHADIHRVAVVRALQCDLAIQLHGSGGLSNPVVQDFGARLTTGFTCQLQRDRPTFFPYLERGHEAARWAPMDCVRHRWVVAADDRAADAVLRASLGLLQTAAG